MPLVQERISHQGWESGKEPELVRTKTAQRKGEKLKISLGRRCDLSEVAYFENDEFCIYHS